PMGLPAPPPPAAGHALRERFPAIGPDDPLVLWWGSVWRWLDAHTVVEAIGRLAAGPRPDVRLVITAGRPANAATDAPNVPADACATLAAGYRWPALLAPLVDAVEDACPAGRSPVHGLAIGAQSVRYYARRAVDRGLDALPAG